ncbi:MAG: DUF4250 domain-containing protein [Bacteroidaceae bacterium]|nr:DUF4250 domain-containing protein [Bacteroidaceae bacterium]
MNTSCPSDPMILLSYINTKLRDTYPTLQELCCAEGLDMAHITGLLAQAGFEYNIEQNKFW